MSTVIIRTSERRDFKRCWFRWYLAWRMGLRKKGKQAAPLWFGNGIHEALAQWYCGPGLRRGMHPADFWIDWVDSETSRLGIDSHEFEEERNLGETMMVNYVETYGIDEHWHVIAPEETFSLSIPYRGGAGEMAIYAGTYDLVYRDLTDDRIWLGEHKTAKQIITSHLAMDDQAGTYLATASTILRHRGVLGAKEEIEGIMYNFLRKGVPDERPEDTEGRKLNKDGSVSKQQPSALLLREPVERTAGEQAAQLERIQTEALWMGEVRKRPNLLTKSPTRDCSWDCQFFDLCQVHEKGGDDWIDFADAMFDQDDPYADHRKSA